MESNKSHRQGESSGLQSQMTVAWLTLLSGVAAVAVFAHGKKPHMAAVADSVAVQAEAVADTAVHWDSVYTAIQQDFVAVRPIFERGCFDCHSTKTHYPWYYRLPIVKGQIDGDIRQARRHVDMTNGFPFKGHGSPADDLDAIREEITSGGMPPLGYRLFHWNAKPDATEADSVVAWINRSLELLAAHGQHPAGDKDEDEGEGQ